MTALFEGGKWLSYGQWAGLTHYPMPPYYGLSLRWLLFVLFTGLILLFLPLIRILALVTGLIALFMAPVGLISKVLLLLLVPLLLLGVHMIITSTKLESRVQKPLRDVTHYHGC